MSLNYIVVIQNRALDIGKCSPGSKQYPAEFCPQIVSTGQFSRHFLFRLKAKIGKSTSEILSKKRFAELRDSINPRNDDGVKIFSSVHFI